MIARFVDSHCHLDFPDFVPDRESVIARARAAGVGTMLTICTKVTEFEPIHEIALSDPDIWCTYGIHPHEAEAQPEIGIPAILAAAQRPKVVGIGECGLDYYYEQSPRERQQAVFRTHAMGARAAGLPLVVHTRDAEADTARILTEESGQGALSGVLHCFTSSRELAFTGLDLGFFISISGIVTFKNAGDLRDTVCAVPLDRLLIETDAPFLAPVPHRGKRNEPAFVARTAAFVAQLKGVSVEALGEATTANFHRLFPRTAAFQAAAA